MAFKATMYWRSMVNGLGGGNKAFATLTTPNMKHFAPTMDAATAYADHLMYWRSMVNGLGGGNKAFTTLTTPNMKHFAPTMDAAAAHADHPKTWSIKGEFAPVYVVMGLVLVAVLMGAHMVKQQLVHSPAVRVNKKKREIVD